MSSYNNIDDAYKSAKETIASVAASNDWTSQQKDTALEDIDKAYKSTDSITSAIGSFVDSLSFESVLDNALSFGSSLSEQANIDLCNKFWNELRNRAAGWSSFPNYDKVAAWLGSSVVAAASAAKAHEEASKTGAIIEGTTATAEDYSELAQKAGNAATDPKTWYLIGAAAVLGAFVYVRGIFR